MDKYEQKILSVIDLHYKYKNYTQARELYKNLISKYPNRPDAYYFLGVLEIDSGNFKKAKEWMHKLIDFPSFDKAHFALAQLYLLEKDAVNSLKYLKLALIYNSSSKEYKALLDKAFPKQANFLKKHNIKKENINFISLENYPKCKYQMVYPAEIIEREPPKYVKEILTEKQKTLLSESFDKYKISTGREAFVMEIPNGRAYVRQSEQTYIITEEGDCVKDMLEQDNRTPNLAELPAEEIEIADKMLVLSSSYGGNFYHWMTWVIPRLHMIEKAGYKLEDFDKILINTVGFEFQRKLIKFLGIPSHKIIGTMPYGGVFKAKTLVTTSLPSFLQTPHFVTDSLREKFLKPELYSEDRPKIIYLSRNKGTRKILNEHELFNYLKNMGFEIVYPEQMEVDEQVATFANADIVLGQHGAGLTNLCFCKPSTKVIEIFNEDLKGYIDSGYFRICSNVKLDHYVMFGEPVPGPNIDMRVDIEKLEKTIELLLSNCHQPV